MGPHFEVKPLACRALLFGTQTATSVSLHFAWYNFGRIHQTLRVKPAMEVDITDHIWTWEEILGDR